MPPKAKFTEEEIIAAALAIARERGMDAVTAREVGAQLNSSARPIFTVFESMEEVHGRVLDAARELYRQYVVEGLKEEIAFRGVGAAYIRFAITEPKLFQILFMSETTASGDVEHILPLIDDSYEEILRSVREPYQLDEETAKRLYRHLWIYTHGIAALCATNVCTFSGEEIGQMMTEVFLGLLAQVKRESGI